MNKREEIMQAITDYQNGSIGKITFDKGLQGKEK